MRAGQWVTRHEESGESRQLRPEAHFVKPVLAITELDARLDRTPNRGEMLITQVEDGRTLSNLGDGARAILMYVKGKNRKSISFRRWNRVVWEASKTVKKEQFSQKLDKETY